MSAAMQNKAPVAPLSRPDEIPIMDRAAFAIVFHEECARARPNADVAKIVRRCMKRINAWRAAQAAHQARIEARHAG